MAFLKGDGKIMELNATEWVCFLTDDPAPYIDGVRINSPHYLCKLILHENSAHSYTLVISQYEKTNTIFYTLRAYATCPFTLAEIGSPYRHTQKVSQDSCFHHWWVKDVGQITLCVVILFILRIWFERCLQSIDWPYPASSQIPLRQLYHLCQARFSCHHMLCRQN